MIRFDKVSKVYKRGARPALDRVSLGVERGEFVFLVGASGSGKSTFLRLVLREERATSGRVHVAGREITTLSQWKVPGLRRQIGVVFQDFRLLPNKTAFDNVALPLRLGGASDQQISTHVSQMLGWLGLGDAMEKKPGELSMGQRQLVSVGRYALRGVARPQELFTLDPFWTA